MALTTGSLGDVSGCVEATVGYFGFRKFASGHYGISWDCTGGADERVFGKDPTMNLNDSTYVGGHSLYVEYIQMSCGSGGPMALVDGSAGNGNQIVTLAGISVGGPVSATWDFKDDPLVCLTADTTQSVCVSSDDAASTGFIKCYWGPNP